MAPKSSLNSGTSSLTPVPAPPTIDYICPFSDIFCLSLAAIVSLGRGGPVMWRTCLPALGQVQQLGDHFQLWVKVTPISLAPSVAGKLFNVTVKLASCYCYTKYLLRLSQRPWGHKPLRRQSLSPGQGHRLCHFTSPCLALSLTS